MGGCDGGGADGGGNGGGGEGALTVTISWVRETAPRDRTPRAVLFVVLNALDAVFARVASKSCPV